MLVFLPLSLLHLTFMHHALAILLTVLLQILPSIPSSSSPSSWRNRRFGSSLGRRFGVGFDRSHCHTQDRVEEKNHDDGQ